MQMNNKQTSIGLIVVVLLAAGFAIAGGQESLTIGAIPVFVWCALLAFGLNWLVYIPSMLAKTEHFYDLTGSATYLSVIAVAVLSVPSLDARAILAAGMVSVWALRLGSFLFLRIRQDGNDDRFDDVKVNPLRFFFAWTLQGLWVLFTVACALAIITTNEQKELGIIAVLGIVMWFVGFAIEVVADAQKRAFKRNPQNKGQFIRSGLWSWSQHPNYFGEILLWSGMAVLALPILNGWQWVTIISPFFVMLLLTRGSGIPLLTEKANKKWGDEPEYQAYVATTPLLILWPPSKL